MDKWAIAKGSQESPGIAESMSVSCQKYLTDVPSEKSTTVLCSAVESAPKDPQNSTNNALQGSEGITKGISSPCPNVPIVILS
jgi:hypothetical protein